MKMQVFEVWPVNHPIGTVEVQADRPDWSLMQWARQHFPRRDWRLTFCDHDQFHVTDEDGHRLEFK